MNRYLARGRKLRSATAAQKGFLRSTMAVLNGSSSRTGGEVVVPRRCRRKR